MEEKLLVSHKLNMFTVGNDCARLIANKALLQRNL